jgi:hypothetical protein
VKRYATCKGWQVDVEKLRRMWVYVGNGQNVTDETLQAIERALYEGHPNLNEQDYKYNLAVRLSDYSHRMMKSQH